MKITFVRKVLPDGTLCGKCAEVQQRMDEGGWTRLIDQTITADLADPDNDGTRIAREFGVERAPFFIVEHDDGRRDVYTVFFKLLKDVLRPLAAARDGASSSDG